MKLNVAKCLMAIWMLSAVGCTNNLGTIDSNPIEEMATVKLSVGLDGMTTSRADLSGTLDGSDYQKEHEISDGTHATTLIYALYKEEKNGDRTLLKSETRENVNFPVDDIEFQLVKGFEYMLVFWAQSPDADKYYDTSDLKAIKVKYTDTDGKAMANNDELRDAFCARRSMKLTQDTEAVNIILKRPFAQINVGMTKTAWDAVVRNYKNIKTSSIKLSGICNTYNLLDDNMIYDEQALVEVEFAAATIPSDEAYKYHTSKYLRVDLDRNGKINDYENENPEEFIWVSMCYVLVPGYTSSDTQDSGSAIEYSTLVDLKQLILGYDGYTDEDTKLGFEASTFELGEVPNLPTLRNHRTNLILDSWPIDTKAITIEICPEYNGNTKHEGSDNTDTPNDGHNALSPR